MNTTVAMKGVGTTNADLFSDIAPAEQTRGTSQQGGFELFSDVQDVKEEPVSTGYDIVRSVGTGVRSGLEGLSGLSGDTAWLYRWLHNKAREGLGYESDPKYVAGTGDYWGKSVFGELPTTADARSASTSFIGEPYKPQTTAGEYAKTAGEFLPASLLGPGSVARKVTAYGLIPATVSETMGQLTKGTEAEPYARAAGAIVPTLGASALSGRAAPTANAASRRAVVEAADRQSVPLPHIVVGDTPVQSLVGAKVSQLPGLGAPIANAVQDTVDTMGRRVDTLASDLGGADKAIASQGAKNALMEWVGPGADAINDAVYARVDKHVNPAVTAPLVNTKKTVMTMLNEADVSTVNSSRSAIDLVMDALLRPQGLNYEGLKQLRTDIGARLSGKITPEPGTSQPALKRLYGALTEDLKDIVQKAGGPDGAMAFERANTTARLIAERRETLARVLGKKGDATPNAVMRGIIGLAGNTNTGSIERLKQVRSVLRSSGGQQSVWKDVQSAIIADLGRDPSSPTRVFSAGRFLTSYGKLSEEGKTVLFGDVKQHLDDLALISERHRAIMRMGNPSGTGGVVTVGALIAGVTKAPLSTIASAIGTYGLARLLARKASAEKIATWAKARNGIIRGSGTVTAQAHLEATRDLAEEISNELGKPYQEVFDALMDGKPQADAMPQGSMKNSPNNSPMNVTAGQPKNNLLRLNADDGKGYLPKETANGGRKNYLNMLGVPNAQ